MDTKKIWAVYFSPTGGTRKVTETIASALGEALALPVEALDYTKPQARQQVYAFQSTDLVVFGVPVYAGRVPNKLLPDLEKGFEGNGAKLIPVSVFGNRSFDDALMELKQVLEAQGFRALAAAGAVSRHSFSQTLAAGRPDREDQAELRAFAQRVARRLLAGEEFPAITVAGNDPVGPYYTPLQADGTPAKFLKAKPETDLSKCTHCGACARACPMGSIDPKDPALVSGICIKCQACVRRCLRGAKYFTDPQMLSHIRMLEQTYARRAENAFFEGER